MISKSGKLAAFVTIAGLAAWLLRRGKRNATTVTSTSGKPRPRIVVAGAGFAGVSTLAELDRQLPRGAADVTLIDQNNYHLFTPLLYQVSTGAVDATNLTYPLRRFCATRGFTFICSSIYGLNPFDKVLTTGMGQIPYDYLVLGLGSETNYFGMQEVQERSFSLKTVTQANQIHTAVVRNFERAAQITDPEERRTLLTFIVVGGGATGIELIGSLHELVAHNLLRYYPEIGRDEAKVILVEASGRVLPGLSPEVGQRALDRFGKIGIDVRLNTMVAGIRDRAVVTRTGERIPGEVIVWTAGIRPSPVGSGLAIEKHRDGRILVDEHLRVPATPSVFALGDISASTDHRNGETLPPNAAVAVQEGKTTGKNLARIIKGKSLLPFKYQPMGELIALGRLKAVAEFGPLVFDGLPAWLVWRMVHLTKLMGTKNRAGLIMDWGASLFANRTIVDTFTEERT